MAIKPKKRAEVFGRDGGVCRECGTEVVLGRYDEGVTAHIHHIEHQSVGGGDSLSNLVTLCRECHLEKHSHGVGGDFTEARDRTLDALSMHGGATTGMILDETGYTPSVVSKRLDKLHAAGCIEYLHEPTALWILERDPRDNDNGE